MSDNEKMQCVLNEMLRQGGIYSGFAEQEAGGFASQLRMLKEDEGDRRGVETCIAVLESEPTVDAVEVVRFSHEFIMN